MPDTSSWYKSISKKRIFNDQPSFLKVKEYLRDKKWIAKRMDERVDETEWIPKLSVVA